MKLKRLFLAAMILGIFSAAASAGSIYDVCTGSVTCSFNMNGIITVTKTTITWTSDLNGAPEFFTFNAGLNPFAGIGLGAQENVYDLNLSAQPVGSQFSAIPFISFPTDPAVPGLNIDFIFPGLYSTATCGGTPAMSQSCTPALDGGSPGPFNLVNNPPPSSPQATATFVFAGVTADHAATWSGNFTSQFNVPFQEVLAGLDSTGSVTNTYSATIRVVSTAPEPGTASLLIGAGLIGVSAFLRRRFKQAR